MDMCGPGGIERINVTSGLELWIDCISQNGRKWPENVCNLVKLELVIRHKLVSTISFIIASHFLIASLVRVFILLRSLL